MKFKEIIILMLLFCGGCVTTKAQYTRHIQSGIGTSFENFIMRNGAPTSQYTLANGNTVYVYRKDNHYQMPSYTTHSGNIAPWGAYSGGSYTSGGGVLSGYCETMFEVDKDQIIVNANVKGNDCAFF